MRENYIVENDLSIIIERRLEKNVMGGNYDSEHLGKHELERIRPFRLSMTDV